MQYTGQGKRRTTKAGASAGAQLGEVLGQHISSGPESYFSLVTETGAQAAFWLHFWT